MGNIDYRVTSSFLFAFFHFVNTLPLQNYVGEESTASIERIGEAAGIGKRSH